MLDFTSYLLFTPRSSRAFSPNESLWEHSGKCALLPRDGALIVNKKQHFKVSQTLVFGPAPIFFLHRTSTSTSVTSFGFSAAMKARRNPKKITCAKAGKEMCSLAFISCCHQVPSCTATVLLFSLSCRRTRPWNGSKLFLYVIAVGFGLNLSSRMWEMILEILVCDISGITWSSLCCHGGEV